MWHKFEERKPHEKVFMVLFMMVMMVGFMGALGLVAMLLWNALMPELFGLPTITFLQTFGLVLLSRIILGGGHHRSRRCGGRHHSTKNQAQVGKSDVGTEVVDITPEPAT